MCVTVLIELLVGVIVGALMLVGLPINPRAVLLGDFEFYLVVMFLAS